MAVTCKKCGGPHPMWECNASAAKIAAHAALAAEVKRVSTLTPAEVTAAHKAGKARKRAANKPQGLAGPASVADAPRANTKPAHKSRKPAKAGGAGPKMPARTAPAAQPQPIQPHPAIEHSNPPFSTMSDETKTALNTLAGAVVKSLGKRGRPRIHDDRKAYKAKMERERRARLKESK